MMDEYIGTLLVVDDEENILKLFQRDFFRTGVEIHTANSYNEAVKIIGDHKIDIIITDLKMERVDGIETLKHVKASNPDIHRILLSGVVEKPEVIKAITNGTASAFVSKPWDREILLDRITHILSNRRKLRERHLLKTIRNINSMPALPEIYIEFMEAYSNDASIKDIAAILHNDAGLTTEVLRIANSAYYGSIQISDLKQGILHLGLKYVKDIVFTVSVTSKMKWNTLQTRELHGIFDHSIRVNRYLSQYFSLKYNENMNTDYSSAGVLHDIGKIIMLQYFPDTYFKIKNHTKANPELNWHRAEIDLNMHGCTHTEIGAFFLDHWNFPEINTEMCLHHHDPEHSPEHLRNFMQGLYYINEFINAYEKGALKTIYDLQKFPLQHLSDDDKEKLFFNLMD